MFFSAWENNGLSMFTMFVKKRKDIKTRLEARLCWQIPVEVSGTPFAQKCPTVHFDGFSYCCFWFWWARTSQAWLGVGGDSYYEVAPLVVREGNRTKDRPLLREQLQRTAAIFCVLWKAASVAANQMRRFWGAKAWLGEGQPGEEPGFCCNYYTFWPPSFEHGCWKSLQ